MNLRDVLAAAQGLGLDRLDAQLLLLHVLGRGPGERAWLLAHDTDALADGAHERFLALCRRRADGEPVAYLTGEKEFHGLPLRVDARVLVPRPDTEAIVDWALDLLRGRAAPRVIDLGTGSGAIAIALAHERPHARVQGVDASAEALALARDNAQRLLPAQRPGGALRWHLGDWMRALPDARECFDLILSNPPYVAEHDPHLAALRFEPRLALVGGRAGPDGLGDIRELVAQAAGRLRDGGWLALEHGYDQAAAVRELLRAAGLGEVHSLRDLAGIERVTAGRARAAAGASPDAPA